jgi:hypothetical protein
MLDALNSVFTLKRSNGKELKVTTQLFSFFRSFRFPFHVVGGAVVVVFATLRNVHTHVYIIIFLITIMIFILILHKKLT